MSPIKKIIIFSVAAAAVIVLVFIFGFVPLFFGIREVVDKIIAEKKSLFSFKNEVAIAEQFEKGYDDWKFNPEEIDKFLANADAPIDLIEFLENTAREGGLLINIYPCSVVRSEEDPWEAMGFGLELTGNFLSFLSFLEKVENSNYFIQIQKIQVRKLTPNDIYLEKYSKFSLEDVKVILNIKVFVK